MSGYPTYLVYRSCGTLSVSGLGLGCQMAIYRLLRNSPLKPEEISRLEAAYEQALRTLCVKERDDPLTEMIAKKIIKYRENRHP
jgi:hypothetical protein